MESHSDHRTCSSRPSQQFVPASGRYAASVQKNRQERRLKRQAELLALQGRSRPSRTGCAPHQEPQLCSTITQGRTGSTRKVGASFTDETAYLARQIFSLRPSRCSRSTTQARRADDCLMKSRSINRAFATFAFASFHCDSLFSCFCRFPEDTAAL